MLAPTGSYPASRKKQERTGRNLLKGFSKKAIPAVQGNLPDGKMPFWLLQREIKIKSKYNKYKKERENHEQHDSRKKLES